MNSVASGRGNQTFMNSFDQSAENMIRPGEIIGVDYFELVRVIGRGTFGKVFLVKKKNDDKYYAMKKMKKEMIIKNNVKEQIMTERLILSRLDNPYLAKLHFAFQTETSLYLVMDFVNGGELFTHLKNKKKFKEDRAR